MDARSPTIRVAGVLALMGGALVVIGLFVPIGTVLAPTQEGVSFRLARLSGGPRAWLSGQLFLWVAALLPLAVGALILRSPPGGRLRGGLLVASTAAGLLILQRSAMPLQVLLNPVTGVALAGGAWLLMAGVIAQFAAALLILSDRGTGRHRGAKGSTWILAAAVLLGPGLYVAALGGFPPEAKTGPLSEGLFPLWAWYLRGLTVTPFFATLVLLGARSVSDRPWIGRAAALAGLLSAGLAAGIALGPWAWPPYAATALGVFLAGAGCLLATALWATIRAPTAARALGAVGLLTVIGGAFAPLSADIGAERAFRIVDLSRHPLELLATAPELAILTALGGGGLILVGIGHLQRTGAGLLLGAGLFAIVGPTVRAVAVTPQWGALLLLTGAILLALGALAAVGEEEPAANPHGEPAPA